jgi:hypothetical protein
MTITTDTAREVTARIRAYGTPESALHSIRVELDAIRPYTSRDLARAANAICVVLKAPPERRAALLTQLEQTATAPSPPPGLCYPDHSEAATTTAADRSPAPWQTIGPYSSRSESRDSSRAIYGIASEPPRSAEEPRLPEPSPDYSARTSIDLTPPTNAHHLTAPVIHLTLTGPDAGRPFCGCNKAARREAGDTFARVPYTNADAFLARPDICSDCLAEWNAAASDDENGGQE